MKKVVSRITLTLFFCLGLLVTFILHPGLAYGNSTTYRNITIYHNSEIAPELKQVIDISLETIKDSEIYPGYINSSLCLNEGFYPRLIKSILGDDVFTAFSNKVVVLGASSTRFNTFDKWDRKMKYSQFLSHALMHNLQFKRHGFWNANPLGNHPDWKWEGYVEYEVLGKLVTLEELTTILATTEAGPYEWVNLTEEEGTIKRHLTFLAMVKYCLEVLAWDYDTLMKSDVTEEELQEAIADHFKGE